MPDTPPSKSEPTPKLLPPPIPEEGGDTPSVGSVLDFGEAGAYTLEERLGSGGMGEVYRARQVGAKGFSQTVAIKRLLRDSRASHEQSFVDEARVLSRLHHENIARVYAFFEHKGSHYLVMEYIEGQTLHALLEVARHKGYRFPEAVACEVMAQVADALNYAHEATDEAGRPLHIVHRDVSPVNILITKAGRAVLVDFGVALSKLDGREATGEERWFKGKVPYLSPEQVGHLPLDGRSDLFAVGTILVEMLIGYPPFGKTPDYSTLLHITQVTSELITALLPGVSPGLVAICQKLLALKPDQRFANGREVALALRRHAGLYEGAPFVQAEVAKLQVLPEGKPLPPPPSPFPVRAQEKKRDKRPLALGGALAFLACVFAVSYVASRHPSAPVPALPPMEKPTMPMTKAAEQPAVAPPSPPAVDEPPKRADGAKAPAVPGASRVPAKRLPPANSCWAALMAAHVVALSACPAHVQTGTKAGDCYATPARDVNGVEIPKEMEVEFLSLNGKKCAGPLDDVTGQLTEPCPAEDGDIVVRIFADPTRGRFLDIFAIEEPFAYGKAHVVPVEGGENLRNPGSAKIRRDYVARLTAVFTLMKMHDGTPVPICGVLFDDDVRTPRSLKRDGIPVLAPNYYGTPAMPTWERATIRLYYPAP